LLSRKHIRTYLWGEVAKTMYIHVSKCKNDKIKGERKNDKRRKKITYLYK
jgi:hypothetical protein